VRLSLLDHYHKQDPTLIPTVQPAYPPVIDPVASATGLVSLRNLVATCIPTPSMALLALTVKAVTVRISSGSAVARLDGAAIRY
jgi:hypothetical protein